MNKLNGSKCTACRKDAPTITDGETDQLMTVLDGWVVEQRDGVKQLEKTFKFMNFITAMEFANKVVEAAEREDHHPAILVEWGKVMVTWWTHKIGGLHKNDFIMAAKTDQLFSHS